MLAVMAAAACALFSSRCSPATMARRSASVTRRVALRERQSATLSGRPLVVLSGGRLFGLSRNSASVAWIVGSKDAPVTGFIRSGERIYLGLSEGGGMHRLCVIDAGGMRRLAPSLPGAVTPLMATGSRVLAAFEEPSQQGDLHASHLFAYDVRRNRVIWRSARTVFPRAIEAGGFPVPTIYPAVAADGTVAPASIVVQSGSIYAATRVGFDVYSLRTGACRWHHSGIGPSLRHSYLSPYPFVMTDPGHIVIGSGEEQVLACLSCLRGEGDESSSLVWQKDMRQPVRTLARSGNTVLGITGTLVAFNNYEANYNETTHLCAVDPYTGRILWSRPFGSSTATRSAPPCLPTGGITLASGMALAAGLNGYGGDLGGYVKQRYGTDPAAIKFDVEAYHIATGKRAWTFPTNGYEDVAGVMNGALIVSVRSDLDKGMLETRVTAVDLKTGRQLWRKPDCKYVCALPGAAALLESRDGSLLAVSSRSGAALRRYVIPGVEGGVRQ